MNVAQISSDDFNNPPLQARPNTYWEWMNGNISKHGITLDLEYMKRANYGAAMIFEAGVGIPKGGVDYNSPQWHDAIIHAMKEAERLGLKLYMHNSPGYSGTGGPWIPAEKSMKQLVWSDKHIESSGNGEIKTDMPQPISKLGFYRDAYVLAYPSVPGDDTDFSDLIKSVSVGGDRIDGSIFTDLDLSTELRLEGGQSVTFELKKPFTARAATMYRGKRELPLDPHDGPRDYAPVITVEASADGVNFSPIGRFTNGPLRELDVPGTMTFEPVTASFFRLTTNRGTNLAEASFHGEPRIENYAPKNGSVNQAIPLVDSKQSADKAFTIDPDRVIDITDKMGPDGKIRWKAPKGRWTIVRIGYTTTGETVAAAPDAGRGLDCDKLSKAGLDAHFDLFLTPLLDELKPWCGSTFDGLAIDSWEAGKQNWTEELPSYFKEKRGYDISPWILTATGRIVESVDDSERFLWDLRRTQADMFIDNYARYFAERMADRGLKYAGEAYGDGNFESLEMAACQDVPMSEFWTHYIYGNIMTTYMAASSAHVWDKPIVACECYTGTPFNSKFTEHPYGMKALGDYIMTAGVNRFVYHATTHQPYTADQPGNIMTMGPFGTHLDRTSTWASHFSDFNTYVSRCSYMLQQGHTVTDFLILKDEGISSAITNYTSSLPYGYRWDAIDKEGVLKRLSADDGLLTLPNGMRYRALVVPDIRRMTPELLQKLIDLTRQGISIVLQGEMPAGHPGLDAEKDKESKRLAALLWGSDTLGEGKIYRGVSFSDLPEALSLAPDFEFVSQNLDAQIHFIHKKSGDSDVYFISNHRRRPERLTVKCRLSGKRPYLWDAETGDTDTTIDWDDNGSSEYVNIDLPESGSIFLVFKPDDSPAPGIREVSPEPATIITESGKRPYSVTDSLGSTFSISLWAKPETFAAANRGFILFPPQGRGNTAFVGIAMGQNGIFVHERNAGNKRVLEYNEPIEGWTHVLLRYDEGVPELFVNGKFAAKGIKSSYDCIPAIDVAMAEEQFIAGFEGDATLPQAYAYAISANEIDSILAGGLPAPAIIGEPLKDLSAEWSVTFPSWSKINGSINMPALESLHKHEDFDVRHFAGTATYTRSFSLHQPADGSRVMLNLGRVENIAEVSVNGSEPVTIWKAPFALDITDYLKEGENDLVVKVTNLYPNRIIGDEHLPELYEYDEYGRLKSFPQWYTDSEPDQRERVLFLPWKHYTEDSPLLESGLIGPVTLSINDRSTVATGN